MNKRKIKNVYILNKGMNVSKTKKEKKHKIQNENG